MYVCDGHLFIALQYDFVCAPKAWSSRLFIGFPHSFFFSFFSKSASGWAVDLLH